MNIYYRDMKNLGTILLALLTLASCSDDVLDLVQEGYLNVNTELLDLTTAKVNVPECTSVVPTHIKVRLINSEGFAFTSYTPVEIIGNQVNLIEQDTLPVGTYNVDEISLLTSGNTVTHTVPSPLDDRFDFTLYTNNPLPFSLVISPGEITEIDADLMCYSEEEVLNAPMFSWFTEIIDLQTLAFNLPESSCVDAITLLVNMDLDGQTVEETINIPLYKRGLYRIPIPINFNYINLRIFVNGQSRQSWAFNSYNDDGILDGNDVIQIPDKCL